MTALRIDHVQLSIPAGAEPVAKAFYEGVFGLQERPKPPDMAARGGAWFERGAVKVHVGVEPGFKPLVKAHVAFVVDDFDQVIQKIRDLGSKVTFDDGIPGLRRAHVLDPFGNRIEIIAGA